MSNKNMHRKNGMGKSPFRVMIPVLILLALLVSACGSTEPGNGFPEDPQVLTREIAAYLMEQVPSPGPASVGGDWLIKGLADSGAEVPASYYDLYYDNVRAEVKFKKGVLSDTYYTEYERVIIGLSSIGKGTVVEGYDLAPYLDDSGKVTAQGVNASCFALIAAQEAGIKLKNEELYIGDILSEIGSGEFTKDPAFADYIAIALQALSYYSGREEIDEFIEEGIRTLSEMQQDDGSYGSCESTAEVIAALGRLGIDPAGDERFIKNSRTVADGLMVYYLGNGKFCHTLEIKEADMMSSEKALLAADVIRLLHE